VAVRVCLWMCKRQALSPQTTQPRQVSSKEHHESCQRLVLAVIESTPREGPAIDTLACQQTCQAIITELVVRSTKARQVWPQLCLYTIRARSV
jgi:hypothetical protein